MAFEHLDMDAIRDPHVRKAVDSLVRVSAWGNSYLVTTPLVYPSGSVVGVRVTPEQGGYWVSDFAMGYREAEAIEAQRSFGSHAGRMKERLGVEYTSGHELRIFATERQIAWAIRRVAYASHRIMQKAYNSAPDWDEQEIGAALYNRLREMYGDSATENVTVLGCSNIDWKFAAQVKVGQRRVLFDVVTPYYSSVTSAVSKFSDVRRLGKHDRPIAVVDDAAKMGKWLPLLSQEAEVIEDDVAEETLRSVVSEAA
ncbi:hypothetical protein [Erythrobacter westpacificensis]